MNKLNEKELIDNLVKYDLQRYLIDLGFIVDNSSLIILTENDIKNLCNISSVFALSEKEEEQEIAYEIITKLFLNFVEEYPNLYSIAYAILSRLGNFPNRELLKSCIKDTISRNNNFLFELEINSREIENKISLIEGNDLLLTDFQKQFFDVLTDTNFFSVSAPTSAGKSFIFTLAIIQRLLKNNKEIIVLVVPTRALIKELSGKIIEKLKEFELIDNVDVRTIPIIENNDEINKGRVYILTQERLVTLLEQDSLNIDTCFVDEAQEVQSNRGVVLQNAIEILLSKYKNVKLFFASPLIKNPNYFSQLFNLNFHEEFFIEKVSPVGQNIIFISEVKNKPQKAHIKLLNKDSKQYDLGGVDLNFKFRNVDKLIELAKQITKDGELSLIYCNGANEAEKKALSLSRELENIEDKEINDLISFIKEDIHHEYSIIKCLKKGVAYHYGNMPSFVRSEIEQLASQNKLKYIFCTSTLLQGVNLPAKNIVLYKPKKGHNNPMRRADFLNLIGRAGRLKYEFQGNIWCIDPDSWSEKSFEGEKLQLVEGFFEKTILNETEQLIGIVHQEDSNDYTHVFGKFYSDFILGNKNIEKYRDKDSFDKIKKLLVESQKLEFDIDLPDKLIKKHCTIHPLKLQKMYDELMKIQDLNDFIPKNIGQKNINLNLKNIFQLIDNIFLSKNNKQYQFYSYIASSWIHNVSIKEMILNYKQQYKKEINSSIREILKTIERYIRYTYVINTNAYIDILKIVISEKLPDYDPESIPNLPLYLESGTSDKTILSLISLGLSRLTSIKLKSSKKFICKDPTPINCFNVLKQLNIDMLDIPEICKKEIRRLVL
ncbi:ski2-like helicase [Phocoenobacter uteri]|uniref:Ski2-like helicase n=1 Tax=Phocoenobacter uteri TaxID=146806 RepID=A0A379CA37_9PAST|nr:DEAD/DEAH box helicase [Phocoenobacter uteri]MDG6881099.1 hypothetical protein [Phocoenobacter uteri]SUB59121.1 ski2-like helicase [Phocoenobacter uteri]